MIDETNRVHHDDRSCFEWKDNIPKSEFQL